MHYQLDLQIIKIPQALLNGNSTHGHVQLSALWLGFQKSELMFSVKSTRAH
jgi:hypothetical protein